MLVYYGIFIEYFMYASIAFILYVNVIFHVFMYIKADICESGVVQFLSENP